MKTSDIIHFLSIILPFANETSIVLTNSGLSLFKQFYVECIDEDLVKGVRISNELKTKLCQKFEYRHKIIIDLIAYLGIMLFICKNTLQYGYVTGVACGLVIIFCSIMLPGLFLGKSIRYITTSLNIKNPFLFIMVGIALIICLIIFTNVLELITQKVTKSIKIDSETEKCTKS